MKKVFLYLSLLMFIPVTTFASTNISTDKNYQALVSKTTSTTGSPITMQIRFNPDGRGCGGSIAADSLKLSITGGATISKTSLSGATAENDQVFNYVSVTINSTTKGTKTISALETCGGTPAPEARSLGSVTFTPPITPSATTTPEKPAVVTPQQKPVTPVITDLKINNAPFQETETSKFEIGNAVQFSGKTIANGKVTLTFNSEPFTDTTTADANGNWTYSLTKNLGEGAHTMSYTVTSPTTNLTSAPTQPVSFTLVAAAKTEAVPVATKEVKKDYTWWYVGGAAGILLILASVFGFIIWKKKSKLS